jgi:hypothetical protein
MATARTAYKKQLAGAVFNRCPPGWNRTNDRLLKRELLYRLSYGRIFASKLYHKQTFCRSASTELEREYPPLQLKQSVFSSKLGMVCVDESF